jgi:hypothetical protein
MANPEHLNILKQGVEVWNQWMKENPGVEGALTHADLTKANLCGANQKGSNLLLTN